MKHTTHKTPGFTIIEIAVVIAVIAILAIIGVLAYTGIQNKARSLQYLSAADIAEDYIEVGAAKNGKVLDALTALNQLYAERGNTGYNSPGWGGGDGICIGEWNDFPAENGFEEGECAMTYYGSEKVSSSIANHFWNDSLKKVAGSSLPVGKLPVVEKRNGTVVTRYRGITYLGIEKGFAVMKWLTPSRSMCGKGQDNEQAMIDSYIQALPTLESFLQTFRAFRYGTLTRAQLATQLGVAEDDEALATLDDRELLDGYILSLETSIAAMKEQINGPATCVRMLRTIDGL